MLKPDDGIRLEAADWSPWRFWPSLGYMGFTSPTLTVQVSVMEAVGLGLASNFLGLCIFFGKESILQVALDLIDPTSVLAYQGHQQAIA